VQAEKVLKSGFENTREISTFTVMKLRYSIRGRYPFLSDEGFVGELELSDIVLNSSQNL